MASLKRRILAGGPMGLNDYMAECLCHPQMGYYMRQDPFGVRGDFTTAPEITQMFGELLGLWAVSVWQQMSCPKSVHLIELGPGRGTLMADALRAAQSLPDFIKAVEVHLVEISPALKACQKQTLAPHADTVTWHDSLHSLPDGPGIIIANEFFDALPLRQFELGDQGWAERCVGLTQDGSGLRYVLKKDEAVRAFIPDQLLDQAEPGAIFETSPLSATLAHVLGDRIATFGGALLAIDYGYDKTGFGETFQALKDHTYHDPLVSPGDADLTAHVNFATLGQSFAEGGAEVFGPVGQGVFLESLGLSQRANILMRQAQGAQRDSLMAAHRRLSHPDEMGTLFKAICATAPGQGIPAGFE